MKKIIYKLINRLGYRIENKKNKYLESIKLLSKYQTLDNFNELVLAKNYILNLQSRYVDFKIENHKEGFLVSFSNISMYVESLEEFHILNEVFVNQDYNLISNDKSVIIDIGTNIGTSAIFFSKLDFVEKIYAFEPLKDTFDQAQYNLKLNVNLHKVVSIKNFGLGSDDREEVFMFNKKTKGNTGVRGRLSPSYSGARNFEKRMVQIKDASIEIENILKETENRKVVIKMDCGGAEYEIIENLKASKLLNNIDILMIEWHDKGAKSIEDILKEFDFESFSLRLGPISGMIYAKKS